MHSPDLTQQNIDKIAELFPTVVTERLDHDGNPVRAIDFDLLRQEVSDHLVEGLQERYQLDWPGKRAALFAANAPIAKTLRPVREESVDFDTTKNLFIEGDNLDALKLLQESYLGKVKLIYIDPPYNTGNDFVYQDHFAETTEEYLERSGQANDGTRLVANAESNGRFHSDWLSMLYPRLKLARALLAPDGAIFVSIGEDEVANLSLMMAELFGRDNLIARFPRVTKKAGKSTDLIALNHDYVVAYARSGAVRINRFAHTDEGYRFEDEFVAQRGRYKLNQTLDYGSIQYSPSLDYEIEVEGEVFRPGGVSREAQLRRQERNPRTDWCWRWSQQLFDFGLEHGFVVIKEGRDGRRIYTKTYESATIKPGPDGYVVVSQERTKALTTLEFVENRYSNDNAKKNLAELFDFTAFDYTKPVELARAIVSLVTDPLAEDIVLDFFAGSATTAHGVMAANEADGGNRRFIMVQLDEQTNMSSEARSKGFETISELARERLRRADAKVGSGPPSGFRSFRVSTTNLLDVWATPDAIDQAQLGGFEETIKSDRTSEDLLFEVLLDWGLELTLPLSVERVEGKELLVVDKGALIACFGFDVGDSLVRAIAERQPLRAVFLDGAFPSDDSRINAGQIFAEVAPATDLRTI